MKYLINVHLPDGEIQTNIFFNTMPEIEAYVEELRAKSVPFIMVVVYENATREAVKIYRAK